MTKPGTWLFLSLNLMCMALCPTLKAQSDDDFYHEEIKALLSDYSTTGIAVMNMLDSLPQDFEINGIQISRSSNKNWSKYIRNPYEIATSLGTTVHESFHALEGSLSYHLIKQNQPETFSRQDDYNSYFTVHNQPILVRRTEVFNSHELKDLIPEDLRAFRYKRYIAQPGGLSAQIHGIYGLMEEWNAYYLGNRTGVDLYDYYIEKAKKDPLVILKYVHQVGGSYFAYYEFKYFILKYLEKSRYRHQEQYKALMENLDLRRAFTEIDKAFVSLIGEFMSSLERIVTDLKPHTNYEIELIGDYLRINGTGAGYFKTEVDKFKRALAKGSLVRVEKEFKIE